MPAYFVAVSSPRPPSVRCPPHLYDAATAVQDAAQRVSHAYTVLYTGVLRHTR